jgi:hypothetical protein
MQDIRFFYNQLKTLDYDRYISIIFAPAEYRDSLVVLYCLNGEIAKISNIQKDFSAAMIKLHWWKETIETLEEKYKGHYIIEKLNLLIQNKTISKKFILDLIESYDFYVQNKQHNNIKELINHASINSSVLFEKSVVICNYNDNNIIRCAHSLGICWYILNNLFKEHLFIPKNIIEQNKDLENNHDSIKTVIDIAESYLATINHVTIPRNIRFLFILYLISKDMIERIKQSNYQIIRTTEKYNKLKLITKSYFYINKY